MKNLLAILAVALSCMAGILLTGCNQTAQEDQIDLDAFVAKNYPNCSKAVVCVDLAYVDCGSAVDGPSYYLNRKTGARISTCGGACWLPDSAQAEACRTRCPPKEWTCSRE